MTEANPYSPPTETRVEPPASDAVPLISQRSLRGAILLGLLGYVGPILILPLVVHVVVETLTMGLFIEWIIELHWPRILAEYLYLAPNLFCLIVFAKAGFLGFPRMLLRDPARRYLAAGTLVFLAVIAYGIVMVGSSTYIGPEPINASIYCGFTMLPSVMRLTKRTLANADQVLGEMEGGRRLP